MNKLIAFSVLALAFATCACAGPIDGEEFSESVLKPTDDEETAELPDNLAIFKDFCIRSRDHILDRIKTESNNAAARTFNLIMEGAGEVGNQVLTAHRESTDRLSQQIANPSASIAAATNDYERQIAEGQREIQEEEVQPQTLFTGLRTALSVVANIIAENAVKVVDAAKNKFGVGEAWKALENGCDLMARYDSELQEMFEETRAKVAAHDPSLSTVTLEKVPCVTSRRISRADSICKLIKAAEAPVTKMMQTRAH